MLGNLKKAVLDINTKIEFAEMSMDLDKYVESLKKEETPEEIAERKAKELQSTLQKLATLQELNRRRSKFIETLDQLTNAENLLSQKAEIDSEQITYSIDFASGETRYNREKLFSITHQEIVLDFVRYLSEKIKDKVATLEAQIIAV
jgi:hypothetical protein